LGFVSSAPLSVLAFGYVRGDSTVDELHRERLVDLVVIHCEASFRQTAAVAIGTTVYVLIQGEDVAGRSRVAQLVERVQTHARSRLGAELLAAVGSTVESVRDVVRSRLEAERVLGVLRDDQKGRTAAGIEDVRSEVVLLELQELSAAHPSLV